MLKVMYEEYARELFALSGREYQEDYAEWEVSKIKSFAQEGMVEIIEKAEGFLIVGKNGYSHPSCEYYIKDLYVRKEFRRRGIARELVSSYMERNHGKYVLRIIDANEGAKRFWQSIGPLIEADDEYNTAEDSTQYFLSAATVCSGR